VTIKKHTCTYIYTNTKVIKNAKLIESWVQLNCPEFYPDEIM
jgi:hypothetical protein